jgi:hypothetical protein
MVGDVIGEASGELIGIRVLSGDPESPRVEVSLRGTGKAYGISFTDTITYWQTVRPNGTFYGEGETMWLTEGGEIATWKGFGIGQPMGPGFSSSWAVAGFFQRVPETLAHLMKVAVVAEYKVEENGNYHWTAYEWRGAAE